MLSAGAIAMFAVPGSASTTCQAGCTFGLGNPGTLVSPGGPYELGVRFSSSVAGLLTSIQFYKAPGESGGHTVHLWNATSTALLGTGTISSGSEPASGFVQVPLNAPVAISAATDYIASYGEHTAYAYDVSFTLAAPFSKPALGYGPYSIGNGSFPGIPDQALYGIQPVLFTAPTAPTGVVASGATSIAASVSFGNDGFVAGTTYTATCQSAYGGLPQSNTGTQSPITVNGLGSSKPGYDAVTCTVTASNIAGSATSAASALTLIGLSGPGTCSGTLTAPTKPTAGPAPCRRR